jgi:sulfonate transport system substrate-binding protein
MIEVPRPPVIGRRTFLTSAIAAAGLALTGCARAGTPANALAAQAPLPTAVPAGTELVIAGPANQLALRLSGLSGKLPFKVPQWPNIGAGPDVINAFRAHSLDVASNAGIPPIQAYGLNLNAKIVAVRLNEKPIYVFATAPGSTINGVNDFRGKKIAFSQGQAQGVVVLRALKQAGLSNTDVTLVPLNSPQFLTALQAKQVDVAPLGYTDSFKYLKQYAKEGAKTLATDVVDLLSILWAPGEVLQDAAKVAAIASYIPIWAQAAAWQWEHADTWIDEYYVKDQGVTKEQGQSIVEHSNKPAFPTSWDRAIAWEQETIELLATAGFSAKFTADVLFDRRFESLASNAVPSTYRA